MKRRDGGAPAVDLLERAVEVVAALPPRLHLLHLAGRAPFALALAAFVGALAPGGRATLPLAGSAWLLAGLYLVSQTARGAYVCALWRRVEGQEAARAEEPSALALALRQARWQPWSLWLLPLSALAAVPFAFVYAFFQSLPLGRDRQSAARHAGLWPRQNHAVLLLLTLVGSIVFLNLLVLLLTAPFVARALLGVESAATLTPLALLAWGPLALVAALSWLVVAPLATAAYALRVADAEARRSGADLVGQLRRWRGAGLVAVAALALAASAAAPATAVPRAARTTAALAPGAGLSVPELDAALDAELAGELYDWRHRDRLEPTPDSWLARFWSGIENAGKAVGRALASFFEKLAEWLRRREPASASSGLLPASLDAGKLLWVLVALALGLAGMLFWRSRAGRARAAASRAVAVAAETAAAPELVEHAADRLASDEWLRWAAELERAGDFRAAARALQLAALSSLARGGWIELASAKTNRDYERELGRRARSRPGLARAWAQTVADVEPVWYGEHRADAELVGSVRLRALEIESDARAA